MNLLKSLLISGCAAICAFAPAARAATASPPKSELKIQAEAYRDGKLVGAIAPVACPLGEPANGFQGFRRGGEYGRAKAVEALRWLRLGDDTRMTDVRIASDCLRRFYGMRSSRQQVMTDMGSGTVFLGAFGALASAKAGATTQLYWTYGAILPVIITQFTATEPMRDLYAGGKVGLQVIDERYDNLALLTTVLRTATHDENGGWRDPVAKKACEEMRISKDLNVETWGTGPDRDALLQDYRKLAAGCDASQRAAQGLKDVSTSSHGWSQTFARAYAKDLLRMDDEILNKDRDLRYSPVETLSSMAAAPFSAAATLLSGQNGTQAVDRLKTQQAFATMNVPLTPIVLPPCPAPSAEVYTVSDSARARLSQLSAEVEAIADDDKTKPASVQKTAQKVKVDSAVAKMSEVAAALNADHSDMLYRHALAAAIASLAAHDRLTFNYDATNGRISVILTSSPDPAGATVAAAAGAAAAR